MAFSEPPKNRESSVRWQGRMIEQFGYSLNLILGLSVATLGYEISYLLNEDYKLNCWQIICAVISVIFLLFSIFLGLYCVVNRLRDFRATAETAYKRENGASKLDLQPLRELTKRLGGKTWRLFKWQAIAFIFSILLLVLAISGSIIEKVIGN